MPIIKPIFNNAARVAKNLLQREKPLPDALLSAYIRNLLIKRKAFLSSASRFGTPQYILDEPALAEQIRRFSQTAEAAFDRFRIYYAVKSNNCPAIVQRVVNDGLGLDVSSGVELMTALATGCSNIIFSGPAKTCDELALAVRHHDAVTVLADSMRELHRIAETVSRLESPKAPLRVGIRIRSSCQGIWTKFGIDLQELPKCLAHWSASRQLKISGIQFHTSWNLDPTAQTRVLNEIGRCLSAVPKHLSGTIEFLDIGGGYWPETGEWLNAENTLIGQLIRLLLPGWQFRPRHFYRKAAPLLFFMNHIAHTIRKLPSPLSNAEIRLEPGRWISTPSMHILLQVIDLKPGRNAVTDGGTNILGWERPLSEFIPVINLTRPSCIEQPMYIFGSLCTPHDIWAMSVFGESAEPGDILLVPDQGAYTYSLRQSFIKPIPGVIRFDGRNLEKIEDQFPPPVKPYH